VIATVEPGDWEGSRYARYTVPFRKSPLEWVSKHDGIIYDRAEGGRRVGQEKVFRNVMGKDSAVQKVKGGVNIRRKRGVPIHIRDRRVSRVSLARGE